MSEPKKQNERDAAQAFVGAWQRAEKALNALRIQELRRMGETESAQRFARLLSPPAPYPLRKSSGLVEQQRIFARLRKVS